MVWCTLLMVWCADNQYTELFDIIREILVGSEQLPNMTTLSIQGK